MTQSRDIKYDLLKMGVKCINCKSCVEIQEDDYTYFICIDVLESESVDEENFFCSEFVAKDVK